MGTAYNAGVAGAMPSAIDDTGTVDPLPSYHTSAVNRAWSGARMRATTTRAVRWVTVQYTRYIVSSADVSMCYSSLDRSVDSKAAHFLIVYSCWQNQVWLDAIAAMRAINAPLVIDTQHRLCAVRVQIGLPPFIPDSDTAFAADFQRCTA